MLGFLVSLPMYKCFQISLLMDSFYAFIFFSTINESAHFGSHSVGHFVSSGGVAQMVERLLSMREVPGSMPGASKSFFKFPLKQIIAFYWSSFTLFM